MLVLLSGGRDSVCLLDLAVRLGCDVAALHVDHGLRPDSAEDAAFCADLCEQPNVELTVRHAGASDGGNVQAWARERRYGAASELAQPRGATIATGHTATDQVETVLYRLAASPGRRALLGMPGARRARLVRPLLEVTREETAAYCAERGLSWREDPSNASDAYARNRVRAELLPVLRALHPAAEANVLRTLALLRDEAAVLDAAVDAALTDEQAALAALPPALARLCLQRLADDAAAGPAPPVGARAARAARARRRRGERRAGPGRRPARRRGVRPPALRARGAPSRRPRAARLEVPGRATFAGGELTCEVGADLAIGDGTLDLDALATPLEVRALAARRPDAPARPRRQPLPAGPLHRPQGPARARARTPVVLSGGEIAWVPGVATGERFRVGPGTRRRARLPGGRRPAPT